MIDVDDLERQIAEAEGDVVAFPKDVLAVLIARLRAGQTAERTLINARSMINLGVAAIAA